MDHSGIRCACRGLFGRLALVYGVAVLSVSLWIGASSVAYADDEHAGAVYALTNSTTGNAVAVFARSADGTITPAGLYPTGGAGIGSGLGSQGAVGLSEDGRWLFAVNAGSNEVTSFAVKPTGLAWATKAPSGGTRPISLTVYKNLLYVLNAGGVNNISGFIVGNDGSLSPLPGSTRPLSGPSVGPAQVQFSPDGGILAVTEKGTNLIDTYVVGRDGLASGPVVHASSGMTPFGFGFGKWGTLIVSEAFGGAPNSSAVSSYLAGNDGSLTTATGTAPTHQTAACWIAVTGNGKYAYTTNAGSATISGYSVAHDGTLALLDATGVTAVTGPGPADMAIANNGRFLYARNGNGTISAFRIEANGSLTPLAGAGGLPAGAVGLAAR
jgi:6-phosphogluconolactonase